MAKLKRDLTMEEQLARGPVDMPFLMLVVLLTGFGVVMVFSASYATAFYDSSDAVQNNPTYYFVRQLIFAAAGLAIMYVTSKINYQTFRWMSVFVLGISIILLVFVIPFGFGRETVGAQRWIRIPIAGSFQPSEIAKLGVILYFAARLSKRNTEMHKRLSPRSQWSGLFALLDRIGLLELIPYGVLLVIIAGLMMLEPHMSGTILIMAAAAAVLFAAGIKLYWFVGGGAALAGLLVLMMSGYQSTRIEIWKDPLGLSPGGGLPDYPVPLRHRLRRPAGSGPGQEQTEVSLPARAGERLYLCHRMRGAGLIGAVVVLILFALLIIRGYWIAIHARDRFGALVVVGITTLLAVQVFLNIAVVTNLLPTTGISLPFFSYGGTALMIQLLEMGIVLGVSRL